MKKIRNLFFVLLLMTVSVCALSFSAGAEYITHSYSENGYDLSDYDHPSHDAPYRDPNETYQETFKYSFDSETGVLVIAPGDEKTNILPIHLLSGSFSSNGEFDDLTLSYDGIEIDRSKIKHIIVEEGFTEIHETFSHLNNLETIVLPDTLKILGNYCFYNCQSLKNLILPSSVTYIGKKAFDGCDSLTKVYYEGEANLDLPGDAAMPSKIDNLNIFSQNGKIMLMWEPCDYADYYRIYQWDYKQKKWTFIVDQKEQEDYWQTYNYDKVVPGEKYRFAVRPVNVNGSDTKWNDFTAAEAVYLIPLQLKATALTGGYKLTWNKVPGAMGYQIWYHTQLYGTYKRYKNAYTESFTKTGLKKGTTYYFRVRPVAELSNGTYQVGEFSAPVKVTVK
ncbi:MAG: leucine-rich repeat protein [Oscillospiraceae bacterium]|nr:leucine-rich repeat protein [Oscillospiraceae bacterium]